MRNVAVLRPHGLGRRAHTVMVSSSKSRRSKHEDLRLPRGPLLVAQGLILVYLSRVSHPAIPSPVPADELIEPDVADGVMRPSEAQDGGSCSIM